MKSEIEEINRRFNEQLERQIAGTLPKGHVYQLGRASLILQSAGIDDLPIELSAERLKIKASEEYKNAHPFLLESIRDLPNAINNPIAVFDSLKKKEGVVDKQDKVILTELKYKENNFVVALRVRKSDDRRFNKIIVNSIRSIYPKDKKESVLYWITEDLIKWVDKEKMRDFFSTQWPNYIAGGLEASQTRAYLNSSNNPADVKLALVDAAKIIQDFNNPKLPEKKIIKKPTVVSNYKKGRGI